MTYSIVIPTYNGAQYIEEALLSALRQSRPADEIIVSDDNSTDDTIAICNKYIERIKIHQNSNGPSGFVNGWNNAIAKAKGDYISILHQDDILEPTFLEEVEKALAFHPDIKHLFAPCNYIDKDGKKFSEPDYYTEETIIYTGKEYIKAYQTVGHPHIHRCPGVVTHKDIFKFCQYREEAGHIADDDFFYRVGQYTDVMGILKPLASYRLHENSETGHLNDAILVKRLLRDMTFQIHHRSENKLFTIENLLFFRKLKTKYMKRLMGYGIKERKLSYILFSFSYIFK